MKSMQLTLVQQSEMRPVKQGRKPHEAYRVREHLTEEEVDTLLAALKANRHGYRQACRCEGGRRPDYCRKTEGSNYKYCSIGAARGAK